MLEEEYQIGFFKENGFIRKQCPRCGKFFWTRDMERQTCGDAPCDPYTFIGNPLFKKSHDLAGMRELFLNYFEENGHKRIERYPVVARWRDDIYLTIASIADFQPFITSGQVPPPANPLTISQPCIRLSDLDAVGRSGRHLTTFEMMAHHAFNTKEKEIYWKDHTLELCDGFLNKLGADPYAVTYKEEPWAGGGNAGACVETLIGGLEVATLVFMNLEQHKDGDITIKGDPYRKMDNYIVDTGYGLERFVWASSGSPTIYDAVFPSVVGELMELAGIEHRLEDEEYSRILSQNARLSGLMDVSEKANLFELRKQVASDIGITVDKLSAITEPVENVYAIADHSRCLTFMLGDGIIPSNVKAGYLARLVIRRTLKMMQDRGITIPLSEIIQMHIRNLPEYPEFAERFDVMSEILDGEETKFQETLARGRKMITKAAKGYKENNEKMPLEAIIEMYDSHGIPPEISKDAAAEAGVEVDLPDNFYSLVADTHSKNTKEEKEDVPFADRLKNLPSTKRLFYDEPNRFEFEAVVLDIFENNIVLDTTLFYPEGGGQPADHGTLAVDDILLQVVDVRMINGVVIHNIDRIEHELHIRKGDLVNGKVNEIRRMAHARHHTATHIVNDAARQVLGNHIWQAGAQKFTDRARLDLSHYKRISQNEIDHIEILANRMVMENKRVLSEWMDRTEAEQKYGFGLYQGGVPPGQKIRVLHVGNDIEACAGTHCTYTGQIGPIKILKTERIQDGVERIEYAAGEAAILAMQQTDRLIRRSAETLRVPAEQLPATTERFFDEWKALKKESRKLKEELAHARVSQLVNQAEGVCGVRLLTQFIQGVDAEGLAKMVKQLSAEHSDLVTLLLSDNDGVKVAASAGKAAIKKGANAGLIVRKVTSVVGGGGGGKPDLAQGGGTDPSRIEEALVSGKEVLFTQIQGNGN